MTKLYHTFCQKVVFLTISLTLFSGALFGQNAAPAPFIVEQYFSNAGTPLAGGQVFSYQAGTSIPQSTFTDASGSVANPNPTVLDANGRAPIFLTAGVGYKLILEDANNVVIWTADDLVVVTPNGGPWTTSGLNIYNSNPGFVGVGCNSVSTVAKLDVCGSSSGANYLIRIDDTSSSPGINFYGNSIKLGSIAGDTSAAFRVRAGNDASQVAFTQGITTFEDQTLTTGATTVNIQAGAGQSTTNLFQINNNSGTTLAFIDSTGEFAAPVFNGTGNSANFTFQNYNSTFLVDTTGDVTLSGQLAIASISGSTQCLQVNSSGIVSGTGAACGSGGGGGGTPGSPTNSLQFNNSGSFGGSSNLLWSNTAQQMNIAGLSGGLTLYVSNGYVQSTGGFDACPSSSACTAATPYTQIQAPTGGVYANSLKAIKYVQTGTSSGAPTPTTSDTFAAGALYWDTGSSCEELYNGSAWACLASGGSTSPGGSNTDVQFNSSGSFGGSGNFTYSSSAQQLNLIGTATSALALYVTSGYIQSVGGFNACAPSSSSCSGATSYVQIQAPGGGVYAKSLRAINYTQTGNSNGVPTVTTSDTFGAGAVYYDTGAGCEELYNGSAWACLGTGGSGITSITATSSASGPGITFASTTNQVAPSNSGNTFSFSLPQQIGTGSSVQFGSVTAQTFTSSASGSTMGFQLPNGGANFYVTGAGALFASSSISSSGTISSTSGGTTFSSSGFAINGSGVENITGLQVTGTGSNGINILNNTSQYSFQTIGGGNFCNSGSCTSGQAISVDGSEVVDSNRNVYANILYVGGTAVINNLQQIVANGYNVTGGYIGQTHTFTIGSCTQYFQSGILVSYAGC